MYPYLEIGSFKFPMYSLLIALGGIAFVVTMIFQFKQNKVRLGLPSFLITLACGLLFFVAGASLWDNICHAIDGTREFGHAGISFLGGVMLGLPFYFLILRIVYQDKISVRILLNCLVPSLLIAHAFGRVGCFFGGCCYGKPTDWAWGVIYPKGSVAADMYGYGTRLIPTPLIEAAFLLITFFLFLFVPLFKQRRTMWYCFFYGIYRFFGEYLRGDSRGGFIPGLSPSQFLSILLVLVGITIILVQHFTHDDGKVPIGRHYILAHMGKLKNRDIVKRADVLQQTVREE